MAFGPARYQERRDRKVTTTDATVTQIDTVNIPQNRTVLVKAYVTGVRTGGASGSAQDSLACEISCAFRSTSGTATRVGGTWLSKGLVADQGTWDVDITTTGNLAQVTVKGASANNVTWRSSEIIIANLA